MRFVTCLLFLATVLPLQAKVLYATNQGFKLQNTVVINTDMDTAWHGLTEQVDQWWPKDHTWWGEDGVLMITPKAGGCFCEFADNKSAEHMRITHVEMPVLLRMTGGLGPLQSMGFHGALDWQFSATKDGTQVQLTYTVIGYYDGDMQQLAQVVDSVQNGQLKGLAEHLSKGD